MMIEGLLSIIIVCLIIILINTSISDSPDLDGLENKLDVLITEVRNIKHSLAEDD